MGGCATGAGYVIVSSLVIPNCSIRLRRVARVMPRSFEARTWLPWVIFSAWRVNSRSSHGRSCSSGSACAALQQHFDRHLRA